MTVPDRANHPKRKVNFYDEKGNFSHSAEVRTVRKTRKGVTSIRPHPGDIRENTKKLGPYHSWEVTD